MQFTVKVYQTMAKESTRPSYLSLVVGVAKDTDAVLSFHKRKSGTNL